MKNIYLLLVAVLVSISGMGQTCIPDSSFINEELGMYPLGFVARDCGGLNAHKTFVGITQIAVPIELTPGNPDTVIIYLDAVKIDSVYGLPDGLEIVTDVMDSASTNNPYGFWNILNPQSNVPSVGCITITGSQAAWDSAMVTATPFGYPEGLHQFGMWVDFRVAQTIPDLSAVMPVGSWLSDSPLIFGQYTYLYTDTALNANLFYCGDLWVYPQTSSDNFFTSSCEGTADIDVLNGMPPYTFQYSNGFSGSNHLDSLCVGIYSVQVTDANGLTGVASFAVSSDSSIYSNIAASQVWIPNTDTLYAYLQNCDLDFTQPVDSFLLVDSVLISNDTILATWIIYQFGDTFTVTGFYPFQGFGPTVMALAVYCMNGRSQPGVFMLFDYITLSGVGIREEDQSLSVVVYPNPSNGTFNLSLETTSTVNIRIMDVSGKIIRSERLEGANLYTIDMTSANVGVYVMEIETAEGRTFQRLVMN